MIVCIVEHVQWRWALKDSTARGYTTDRDRVRGHGTWRACLLYEGGGVIKPHPILVYMENHNSDRATDAAK